MRANKLIKLLLWLVLLLLCLFLLAMQKGFPRYSRQSAIHRAEERQLLTLSRALTSVDMNPDRNNEMPWRRQLQIGLTDGQLRAGLLKRSDLAWECDWVMVYPLKDTTAGILPWELYASPESVLDCGFVWDPRLWARGEATLTVGDQTCFTTFQPDDTGFALIPFADLTDDGADPYYQQMVRLQREEMEYNDFYILDDRIMDITLEVVLYDQAGEETARTVTEYPAKGQ